MRWICSLLLVSGCYPNQPDLPLLDEIPIVPSAACRSQDFARRVACVLDGDTIALDDCRDNVGERIRLLGVNAPEIAHEDQPAQCWGYESAQALTQLLSAEDINLTFDRVCLDVYDRTLAYITLPDSSLQDVLDNADDMTPEEYQDALDRANSRGTLVNEWMLQRGHARYFVPEGQEELQETRRLQAAEALARARGLGLWGACGDDG